jgi:hypothetical protein
VQRAANFTKSDTDFWGTVQQSPQRTDEQFLSAVIHPVSLPHHHFGRAPRWVPGRRGFSVKDEQDWKSRWNRASLGSSTIEKVMPVPQPSYFDSTLVNTIPKLPGIYAFFVDFRYLVRTVTHRPAGPVDFKDLLEKSIRAHTAGNPPDFVMKVTKMTSFGSFYTAQATHGITVEDENPQLQKPAARELASVLAKCSLLSRPIYVGITEKTLYTRYRQHKKNYEKFKQLTTGKSLPTDRKKFARGGELYHRLVRRRVEFRDLIFACVPLLPGEVPFAAYVEKVIHALAAPSLSDNH